MLGGGEYNRMTRKSSLAGAPMIQQATATSDFDVFA
jgi:hypothetical protein